MMPILNKDLGPIPDKRRRKNNPGQVVAMGGIHGPGYHNHKRKQVAINFCLSTDGISIRIVAEVPQYNISFSMPTEDNEPEILYAAATAAIKAKMTIRGYHVHNMDFMAAVMPARSHTAMVTP